jgi:hypothetical protein
MYNEQGRVSRDLSADKRSKEQGEQERERDPSGRVACPLGQRVHTIYVFDAGEERREKEDDAGEEDERNTEWEN